MYTVYGMASSGNCYKVRLVLEQLALPYRWVEIDSTRGATRTAEFLAKNPNGKVPALQLEDGSFLPERLVQAGFRLKSFKEKEVNLENVFMEITKGITN